MKYKENRITEICEIILGGTPNTKKASYWNGIIPWASVVDFTDNKYLEKTEKTITEEGLKKSNTKLLYKNDIIISARGTVGKIVKCKRRIAFNQSCYALRTKNGKEWEQDYIYYLLKYKVLEFKQIAIGGVFDTITIRTFEKMKVKFPPLPTQKKIAAVLSSYDDLIENNNRRIAILEKMAEEIYKEWFVRMRFPNHENTKFVKGVPEGWEVVQLNQIADEVSKGTKSGEHLQNRNYLPLDLFSRKRFLPNSHSDYTEAKSSLILFEKGDFLFGAMRPYLHKVNIAPFDGVTRTTCFIIRPKEKEFYSYIFLLLFQKSTINFSNIIANGSDRPYVVWNRNFEKMNVFKPQKELIVKFDNFVKPIFDQITSKYSLLLNLKQTRDRLLPRLISGKLSVEELNIKFPKSMEE